MGPCIDLESQLLFWRHPVCGAVRTQPASPAPGTGSAPSITGRERLGWVRRLTVFPSSRRFAIHLRRRRSHTEIADASCSTAAGPNGYCAAASSPPCPTARIGWSSRLSTISADGTIVESHVFSPLTVSVTALTAAAAPEWADGQIETTRDGLTLRADKLAAGLDRPVDAAFVTDGRLFIVERAGRIRVVTNGEIQDPDALTLVSDDDGSSLAVLSIAAT